jgi:hypothetical protein
MRSRKPIKKDDYGKRITEPDIRPLDQRSKVKRINPGQKPDASEQLFFDPDSDLEPAYIKKLKSAAGTARFEQ